MALTIDLDAGNVHMCVALVEQIREMIDRGEFPIDFDAEINNAQSDVFTGNEEESYFVIRIIK